MATAKTLNLGDGSNTTVTLNNFGSIFAKNTSGYGSAVTVTDKHGIKMDMEISYSSSNHGLYSYGYSTGHNDTSYVASGKWLVYRDSSGNVYLKGNADTATTANNINNTPFPGNANGATYYVPLFAGTTAGTSRAVYTDGTYGGPRCYLKNGTTTAAGSASLTLGNNLSSTTAKNAGGYINLYSTGTIYGSLRQLDTSNIPTGGYFSHYLPPASGTLLNTDIICYYNSSGNKQGISPSSTNYISQCVSKKTYLTIDTTNSYLCKINFFGRTFVFMNVKIIQSGNNFSAKTSYEVMQLPAGFYNTKSYQPVIWAGPATEASGAAPNAYVKTNGIMSIRMNGAATNCNDNYFTRFWEVY